MRQSEWGNDPTVGTSTVNRGLSSNYAFTKPTVLKFGLHGLKGEFFLLLTFS